MIVLQSKRPLKRLDFDIENRPLSYWVPDQPTAEITAIAWAWVDQPIVDVRLLGVHTGEQILQDFVEVYNQADIVTGHYIKRHDLPLINGALMEYGMPSLEPKLVCDTRTDLIKKLAIPATQEFLADMLGIPYPKIHMTQTDWREANRLTDAGLKKTRARVTGDVIQHIALREEMLKRNLLHAPKYWRA